MIAGVFGVERAFAVADPQPDRATKFLPKHVAVWQTSKAARFLYDFGKTARNRAEEAMAGVHDFNGGILIGLGLGVGLLSRRVGWCLVRLGHQRASLRTGENEDESGVTQKGRALSAPLALHEGFVDMKLLTFA